MCLILLMGRTRNTDSHCDLLDYEAYRGEILFGITLNPEDGSITSCRQADMRYKISQYQSPAEYNLKLHIQYMKGDRITLTLNIPRGVL